MSIEDAFEIASGRLRSRCSMIKIKRAYEPPEATDGRRILVERLWPRGITKAALAADEWAKDVAPTTELRKWFDHRVDRWAEFQRRYQKELDAHPDGWQPIIDESKHGAVTLLYSARDTKHNGAVVLRDYLSRRLPMKSRRARSRTNVRAR